MYEEQGIPGIALVTAPFRQTGAAMAATWGLPSFEFLDVPHPIAILDDDQMDDLVEDLVRKVIEQLGRGMPPTR